MRKNLAKLGNQSRFTFRGKFARYGYKRAVDRRGNEHYAPTLLLTDLMVKDGDQWKAATDHLQFNLTKGFWKLGLLKVGDEVQLNGRVNDYYKGYFSDVKQRDVKLSYPSKISRVNSEKNVIPLPEEKNAIIGLIMNLEWKFYTEQGRPIDDYYLDEFKNCKENKQFNYGVKVHKSAPMTMDFVPTYDYDDYDPADDFDDDYDDIVLEQQQAAASRRSKRKHRNRVRRAREWLGAHEELVDTLQKMCQDTTILKEKRKQQLNAFLAKYFVPDSDSDQAPDAQLGQLRNDVQAYFAK